MNAERRDLITDAADHLQRARTLAPDTPRYAALLGRALMMLGRADDALPHLEAGFRDDHPPVYAWLIAVAHHLRGDHEKSRVWASVALEESPHFPRALALRAESCERLGGEDEAIGDWRAATDLEPKRDLFRLRLCALLIRRAWACDDPEIRKARLEEVRGLLLDSMPTAHEPVWRYVVGCVLLELGDARRALVHLSRTTHPDSAEIELRTGVAELMLGNREIGVPLLKAAAENEHTSAAATAALERSEDGRGHLPGVERLPPPSLENLPSIDFASLLVAEDAASSEDSDPSIVVPSGILDEDAEQASVVPDPAPETPAPAEKAGTFDVDKARDLLKTGKERVNEGRHRLAGATLCRAFDVLDRPWPASDGVKELRRDILRALLDASEDEEVILPLARRAEMVIEDLGREDAPLARSIVARATRREDQFDDTLWRLYVGFLDAQIPSDPELRQAVITLLSNRLYIGLNSKIETVEPIVPLLERLHRRRPQLAFARLYLGRWACMQERYEDASELLAGVRGRLASRPKILNLRGRCAELLGRHDEADKMFRRSLSVREEQPDILFRVGRLALNRALGLPQRSTHDAAEPAQTPAETEEAVM